VALVLALAALAPPDMVARMAIVELSATDCDGYAFLAPRTSAMRGERCSGCGGVLDKAATPIDRVAFRKRYDFGFTYDD
jgi:hypothetical protein